MHVDLLAASVPTTSLMFGGPLGLPFGTNPGSLRFGTLIAVLKSSVYSTGMETHGAVLTRDLLQTPRGRLLVLGCWKQRRYLAQSTNRPILYLPYLDLLPASLSDLRHLHDLLPLFYFQTRTESH